MIQAKVLGFDDVEKAIITNHLHDVERRNLNAITKALDIDMEEVIDAVQEIQKLESVPARNFSGIDERTIAITPDVYLETGGGEWIARHLERQLSQYQRPQRGPRYIYTFPEAIGPKQYCRAGIPKPTQQPIALSFTLHQHGPTALQLTSNRRRHTPQRGIAGKQHKHAAIRRISEINYGSLHRQVMAGAIAAGVGHIGGNPQQTL